MQAQIGDPPTETEPAGPAPGAQSLLPSAAGFGRETAEQRVETLERGGRIERLFPHPLQHVALKHRDDGSCHDRRIEFFADQPKALSALQQFYDYRNRSVNA